jgi:hypothetical protein
MPLVQLSFRAPQYQVQYLARKTCSRVRIKRIILKKKKNLPGEKIIAEEGLVAADGELKDEDEDDDELLGDFSSCKFLG